MNRKLEIIAPPDSVSSAGATTTILDSLSPVSPTDTAAEAAALEACQVSAMLAAAAMSLTNLRPDALPRLLQRP